MTDELTCVLCPNGCPLQASQEETEWNISGNLCPKGQEFAVKELTDPERILTTTVKVKNRRELLSVRSDLPVKKAELPELVRQLRSFEAERPVRIGQVLLRNMGKNSVSILATSNVIS